MLQGTFTGGPVVLRPVRVTPCCTCADGISVTGRVADSVFVLLCLLAIHQDEDDGLDDNQVRSPFGSSFRTFDGTDYSSIGKHAVDIIVLITIIYIS